jgi:uncharacterized UPF0160 family protein
MSFFNKKKILVTHNSTFHADDLFSTATLSILNKGNIKVVRTRDEKMIKSADFVYDVGGEYNPSTNRFDHHQKGGAGFRSNGIPYASFGLVWKTYGEQICGNKEIADKIDQKLVASIDANDNGINLFEVKGDIAPYTLQDILFCFRPSWKEEQDYDKSFMELVPFAIRIITREIIITRGELEADSIIKKAYEDSNDKRMIILDGHYPWGEILSQNLEQYKEVLYIVSVKSDLWRVEAVRKDKNNFENRKPLPESWAGKRDDDLAKTTGVSDATFCHNARFLAVAKSKEGAIALAEKALLA